MESNCDPNSPECTCWCGCGCQDDPNGCDLPFVNGLCASCAVGNHEVPPESDPKPSMQRGTNNMAKDRDKKLLEAWENYRCVHWADEKTAPQSTIDAFLAVRQPQAAPPDEVLLPPRPEVAAIARKAMDAQRPEEFKALAEKLAAVPAMTTPSAPHRFWRVVPFGLNSDHSSRWEAVECWADGLMVAGKHPFSPESRRTREQAEADGRASGLPEFKP